MNDFMVSKIIYYAVIAFLTMFCVGCEKVSDENVLVSCLVNGVQYETKVPYYLGMTGLDFEQYDESCVFMLFRWLYCDDEAFCLAHKDYFKLLNLFKQFKIDKDSIFHVLKKLHGVEDSLTMNNY